MKVLFIAGLFYPSSLGGPAKTIYWLGSALAKTGIDVDIITTNLSIAKDAISVFGQWISMNGMRVYYTDTSKLQNKISKKWSNPVRTIIKQSMSSNNYDVVINSSMFYLPTFTAAKYAKRIIWSPRGELLPSAIQNNIRKKLYICLLKALFKNKTVFHATSTVEENVIKQFFGKDAKTCIIPNLMNVPRQLDRNPKSKYLLYVGRLSPIKALDNLVEGLAKSSIFMNSEYVMVFIGSKEEKYLSFYDEWIKQIDDLGLKNKIVFAGIIDGEEKYKMYANAYFSFLVSHSENFGNVVIEALSQGTPVIASRGTPWQKLEDNKSGLWIENDPLSIAAAVDKVLTMSKEEYKDFRKNARIFSEQFDVDRNIGIWTSVLESFVYNGKS